jgi:hypothetical protein
MAQSGAYIAGQAPFIEAQYGASEVAQAFVRNACVHGASVALATPPQAAMLRGGRVTGVRLGRHTVACGAVAGSFRYLGCLQRSAEGSPRGAGTTRVARAIVVLTRPLLPHLTNCRVVVPPRECGNAFAVVAWQCHSSLHVCPPGAVLLHLAGRCAERQTARACLEPCILALAAAQGRTEQGSHGPNDCADASPAASLEERSAQAAAAPPAASSRIHPDVALALFYTQVAHSEAATGLPENVVCCGGGSADSTMDDSLLRAEALFTGAASATEEQDGDDLEAALKALGLG